MKCFHWDIHTHFGKKKSKDVNQQVITYCFKHFKNHVRSVRRYGVNDLEGNDLDL